MDFTVCYQTVRRGGLAQASDYSHELDLIAAKQMIHESVESDLTHDQKVKLLGLNAKRVFRV